MSTTDHAHRRTVHVVAVALFQPDAEGHRNLFVARRAAGRRHGGLWELPGGQVEAGETEREALTREIQEELSVSVTLDERLGAATVDAGAIDVHMVVFVARGFTGELTLVDHDASRWVDAQALQTLSWAPADIPHLPALLALLSDVTAHSTDPVSAPLRE
jgi:8-oxo-dGTP diphosphatase